MLPVLAAQSRTTSPAIATQSLIEAWLDGRKPSTVAGYRRDLDHFSEFLASNATEGFFPAIPTTAECLDAFLLFAPGIANGAVLLYRNDQLARGLASATIARRMAAIRSVVKLARTLGRVNWSIEVEAPKHEDRRDMRGPTDAERKKLMKALGSLGDSLRAKRDRAVYAMLFTMLLRRSEVVSLDLADVDFIEDKVSVIRKGHREKHKLPIPTQTRKALQEWIIARGPGPGPLFLRTDHVSAKRLSGESIRRLLITLSKVAGLRTSIRPHGLRHAGITKLLSGGETDRNVMSLSGHADAKTLRRYDDRKDEAAETMAQKIDTELR